MLKFAPKLACRITRTFLKRFVGGITATRVTLPAITNATTTIKRRPLKMSGWQIHSYGDFDELEYTKKLRMPRICESNECLIRVKTTTVNPIDVIMLGGYAATSLNALRDGIEFPLTLGREFCGELVHRGMSVNPNLDIGQRVWGVVPLHLNGCHAEYVAVPEYCVSPAPVNLTNEEAASVLYAGLTAWSGLYITAGIGGLCGAVNATGGGSNKSVLVLGGSGSVGSLAIQILKSQGAKVSATCSSNAVEMVQSLGADFVADYGDDSQIIALKRHGPFDVVLDCAGLGTQYTEQLGSSFKQYITFSSKLVHNFDNHGFGLGAVQNLTDLLENNIKSFSSHGGVIKYGFFIPAPNAIQFLKKLVDQKKLHPLIDSCYGFEQLPQAFEKVRNGHLRGKVVVTRK